MCRSVGHRDASSDTSPDTLPAITAVRVITAHTFVINRARLLIGGNSYLGGVKLPLAENH